MKFLHLIDYEINDEKFRINNSVDCARFFVLFFSSSHFLLFFPNTDLIGNMLAPWHSLCLINTQNGRPSSVRAN